MAIEVLAPIAGTVWRVTARKGQLVGGEEPLAILESMKMEIPVSAPQSGCVVELRVVEGQVVEEGDVIAVLGQVGGS